MTDVGLVLSSIPKLVTRDRPLHLNLFHVKITIVLALVCRLSIVMINSDWLFPRTNIPNPENPTSGFTFILNENILLIPLTRNPNRYRNMRTTYGVRRSQKLLSKSISLPKVLYLLLCKIKPRSRSLQHLLQASIRHLA